MTPAEVEKLLQASGTVGRPAARERTLILLAYRHGLRISQLVTMRWEQIDLKAGLVHVAPLKNGLASTTVPGQPLAIFVSMPKPHVPATTT